MSVLMTRQEDQAHFGKHRSTRPNRQAPGTAEDTPVRAVAAVPPDRSKSRTRSAPPRAAHPLPPTSAAGRSSRRAEPLLELLSAPSLVVLGAKTLRHVRQSATGDLAAPVGPRPADSSCSPHPPGSHLLRQPMKRPLDLPHLITPGQTALHALERPIRNRVDQGLQRGTDAGRPASQATSSSSCHEPSRSSQLPASRRVLVRSTRPQRVIISGARIDCKDLIIGLVGRRAVDHHSE